MITATDPAGTNEDLIIAAWRIMTRACNFRALRQLLLSTTAANSLSSMFKHQSASSELEIAHGPVEDASWQLVHVSAYFRHGARAPVYGLKLEGVRDCNWSTCGPCAAASSLVEAGTDTIIRLREHGTSCDAPLASAVDANQRRSVLPGGCRSGELTSLGEAQAVELGDHLRALYKDALELDSTKLSARTTNVARCVLSLRGVIKGLLSGSVPASPVLADTVHASREWLTPASRQCARLRQLWDAIEAAEPLRNARFVSLLTKLERAGVASLYQFPDRAVPLKDALIARDSLGEPLPWGLDHADLEVIDLAAAREVARLNGVGLNDKKTSAELKKLCAGRLVHELRTELLKTNPDTMRLVSGHDTTVLPLLVALEAYDERWPPFCACILVELYQSPHDHRRRAVRVLYNGLTAPSVSNAGGDFYVVRTLHSLDDFIILLDKSSLSPAEFVAACGAVNLKSDELDVGPTEKAPATPIGGSTF